MFLSMSVKCTYDKDIYQALCNNWFDRLDALLPALIHSVNDVLFFCSRIIRWFPLDSYSECAIKNQRSEYASISVRMAWVDDEWVYYGSVVVPASDLSCDNVQIAGNPLSPTHL